MTNSTILYIPGWSFDDEFEMLNGQDSFVTQPSRIKTFSFSSGLSVFDLRKKLQEEIEIIDTKATIVAWSLGGMLALDVAKRYQNKIDKIILISTTPRFTRLNHDNWNVGWPEKIIMAMSKKIQNDEQSVLKTFRQKLFSDKEVELGLYKRFSNKFWFTKTKWKTKTLLSGLEYLKNKDLRDDVPKIYVPTFIIHGTGDKISPLTAGRWLGENLPNAKLHEIKDAGHIPFVTFPKQFGNAFQEFLT